VRAIYRAEARLRALVTRVVALLKGAQRALFCPRNSEMKPLRLFFRGVRCAFCARALWSA